MSKVKQIVQFHLQGKPIKWIARTTNVSKNTVRKYIALSGKSVMDSKELLELTDEELEAELLPELETTRDERHDYLIDRYDYIIQELKKTGVTRFLLWSEYRYSCPGGYSYSQFCWHLQQLDKQNSISGIINHEPGDLLYVDFTGKLMKYVNTDSGEIIKTQVLVATLGYSQYSYVEAVHSQKAEDFVGALSRAMTFFGRVPKGIVPDNLKSAVVKSDRYEPAINQLLDDFANHYGTTIIPTRVASPKDKSLAENMVKHAYRKIYAPLRNQEFYSLVDLNTAILEKLGDYHNCKFQSRDYNRQDLFDQEKQHLGPLPDLPFEIKKRREVTVQKNSHIFLGEDKHYYSVPYQWIGQKAKIVYNQNKVDVYVGLKLVASHQREYAFHRYSTQREHLPSHLQHYSDRSPDYYKQRAEKIAPEVYTVIAQILERRNHPEQAYKSCDGVLSLGRKVEKEVFINACRIAEQTGEFSYGFIKRVILNGMAKQIPETPNLFSLPIHNNIRGKSNYQ